MRFFLIGLSLLALAGASLAQTPPAPHVLKFREYRAAMEKQDFTAAEAAGAEALSLAETALGDSPQVAALAVNLAAVRLTLRQPEAARAPLQRVAALSGKGINAAAPADLELLNAWAGLDPKEAAARRRLLAAVENGAAQGSYRFGAATVLAVGALDAQDYDLAARAAKVRADTAEFSGLGKDYARSIALTQQARAQVNEAMVVLLRRRPGEHIDFASKMEARFRDALAAAREAELLARGLTPPQPDGRITLATQAWADAAVWRLVAWSSLQSRGEVTKEFAVRSEGSLIDLANEQGGRAVQHGTEPTSTTCAISPKKRPFVQFPVGAGDRGAYGAVAGLLKIDANGVVERFVPISEAPVGTFSEPVARAFAGFQTELAENSAPGCKREGWLYYQSVFFFESAR